MLHPRKEKEIAFGTENIAQLRDYRTLTLKKHFFLIKSEN